MQSTSTIFLVRPANFGFNEETAASNAFQQKQSNKDGVQTLALAEFDSAVNTLKNAGVNLIVFDDNASPIKPDAIFPNNWISLHDNGTLVLYPMHAANRRLERRVDIVEQLKSQYSINNVIDLSHHENENRFLEGTGSVVFDHLHKIAYACLSPRTDRKLLEELCDKLGYKPVSFIAQDKAGKEIYHTNVMMCIAEKFAVVCLESMSDAEARKQLVETLEQTHHEVIAISLQQMNSYAGNMLSLKSTSGDDLLVMSQSAYEVLNDEQKASINRYTKIITLQIPTIETIGGGSARCMMAEVFSSKK